MSLYKIFKAAFFPKPKIIVATTKRKEVDCSLYGNTHMRLAHELLNDRIARQRISYLPKQDDGKDHARF